MLCSGELHSLSPRQPGKLIEFLMEKGKNEKKKKTQGEAQDTNRVVTGMMSLTHPHPSATKGGPSLWCPCQTIARPSSKKTDKCHLHLTIRRSGVRFEHSVSQRKEDSNHGRCMYEVVCHKDGFSLEGITVGGDTCCHNPLDRCSKLDCSTTAERAQGNDAATAVVLHGRDE